SPMRSGLMVFGAAMGAKRHGSPAHARAPATNGDPSGGSRTSGSIGSGGSVLMTLRRNQDNTRVAPDSLYTSIRATHEPLGYPVAWTPSHNPCKYIAPRARSYSP